jgi:hypothetical protein
VSYDRMLATAYDRRCNRPVLDCPVKCEVCGDRIEQLDALRLPNSTDWLCQHCGIKCDSCCQVMRHTDATVTGGDKWCQECIDSALETALLERVYMPIIAKESGGSFTPAPTGLHQAICCDVVDLGEIKTSWEGKERTSHKVRLVFEIDEEMPDGGRFTVNRRYTLSLGERAALRKDLDSWRGRAFNAEELKGFDLEKLIGVNCMVNVNHEVREGSTWANITAITPLAKGMQKMTISPKYVRVKDRPANGNGNGHDQGITDEDVPF